MKNLHDVLLRFNWIDIFVVILAIRIIYISFKGGLKVEFFKILGTLSALYVSLHYFSSLSLFLNTRIFNQKTTTSFLDTLSFIALMCAGYGVFFLFRILIGKVVQSEVHSQLDKWGGLAVGTGRAVLTVSLFLCLFLATGSAYFRKCVHSSFSGTCITRAAADTYVFFWDSFASKLQTNEKINPAVSDFTKI